MTALLLAAPGWAYAQPFPVDDVSPPGDFGAASRLAVDSQSNAVVVWGVTSQTGTYLGLRVARYAAATGTWSAPVDLAHAENNGNTRYSVDDIAFDSAGNAIVAGRRFYFITGQGIAPDDVIAWRYSVATGQWSAFTVLSPFTWDFGTTPHVVMDAAGNGIVTWSQGACGQCLGQNLHVAHYAPASGWTTRVLAQGIDLTIVPGFDPQLAADANGNALAIFARKAPAGTNGLRIFAMRYESVSRTWGAEQTVASTPDVSYSVSIAMERRGSAMLAWGGFSEGLFVARLDAMTGRWDAPERLSDAGLGAQSPSLAAGPNGEFIAVWQRPASSTITPHLQARRFSPGTGVWEPATLLAEQGSSGQVVIDNSGTATAAWQQSGTSLSVQAARFTPATGGWSQPVRLNAEGVTGQLTIFGGLGADAVGNARVVWTTSSGTGRDFARSVQSTAWPAGATPGPPTGPPGAPTNVRATVSGHTLTVSWGTPSSGAPPTGYNLIGRVTAGGPVLATVPMGAGTSFSVTAPDGSFVLTVTAANASGTGPESSAVSVTVPQIATAPPDPPSNLAATASDSTATFTWAVPTSGGPVEGYLLVAGLTPGFGAPLATLPLGPAASVSVPGVPAGTYYVRVLARNALGTSAPSNEVSLTVFGAAPPGAPTLRAPIVTGNTVTLSWTAGSGPAPTSYTLMASAASSGPPIATVPLTSTTATFSGVPNGTYYVRVTASNAAGTSAPSNEAFMSVGPVTGSTLLPLVNEWRQRAGVAPLVEEPSWSVGASNHADYVLRNRSTTGGARRSFDPEDARLDGYTTSGSEAATNSLLLLSIYQNLPARTIVSSWARGAFTSLLLLDPRLQRTGGGYRTNQYSGTSAVLDVLRGRSSAMTVGPTTFPRSGGAVVAECPERTTYAACAGDDYPPVVGFCHIPNTDPYNYPTFGMPLWIQFGGTVNPVVTSATLTTGGTVLPVCTITADTYVAQGDPATQALGRTILRDRGAVVLVPPSTLPAGKTYTATVTVNGQQYTWTFDVV